MAKPTKKRTQQYVLDYFHRDWPNATLTTTLRGELNLDDYDIYDIGRDLRGWKGANWAPSEFEKCKTIGAIADLVFKKLP